MDSGSLELVLQSLINHRDMQDRIIADYRERNAKLEEQVFRLAKENRELKERIGDRCC